MNCNQAKAEIALWVGNDLDESAERSLRRHLSKCLGCRKYLRRMKASLRMLQEAGDDLSETEDVSLWPRLSAALSAAEEQNARRSRFNGWVPALAVSAACLAMISLSNSTPSVERSSNPSSISVQPIASDVLGPREAFLDLSAEMEPSVFSPGLILRSQRIEDDRSAAPPKKKAKRRPIR